MRLHLAPRTCAILLQPLRRTTQTHVYERLLSRTPLQHVQKTRRNPRAAAAPCSCSRNTLPCARHWCRCVCTEVRVCKTHTPTGAHTQAEQSQPHVYIHFLKQDGPTRLFAQDSKGNLHSRVLFLQSVCACHTRMRCLICGQVQQHLHTSASRL
jgi:hypothetical protein